jgi:cysteine synthase
VTHDGGPSSAACIWSLFPTLTPDCSVRGSHVRRLCATDERYVWLNQYENHANWRAHYRGTAPAVAAAFPQLDVPSWVPAPAGR